MQEEPTTFEEPTNLPDDLHERAERVFEHVETWSNKGNFQYVYPMDGPKDTRLMLDCMEIEVGTIFELHGDREIVVDEGTYQVKWIDGTHERPWIKTKALKDDRTETRTYRMGDGLTIINLWKEYIYDNLEVVGHISDV